MPLNAKEGCRDRSTLFPEMLETCNKHQKQPCTYLHQAHVIMSLRLATRALPRAQPARTFATTTYRMAAGDTGSPRSAAGGAGGDAFSKREHANEEMEIRRREKEKLEALKKKIADSEAQLSKDRAEAEELNKKQ
ncbi:hypothetical protein KC333_g4787 [Hortaea werneckii]|nr:hypothetical protein KC333_g4787 [Hortaea werneckii]KAI7312035.1 hypothetical protein KC326_g6021 [Hortaea werneckii]